MTFVLVPGFWLGAESWHDVSDRLSKAGVKSNALTLPGLERDADDAGSVRLIEHINAVRAAIDTVDDDVVLVGHSGAGPICHAAAAQAARRVRRIVHVDTWPLPPGFSINPELAGDADVIELPDWSAFEPEDLVDMTTQIRERLQRESRPQPAAVARDQFPAMAEDRFSTPTTIVCCEFTSEQLRKWTTSEPQRFDELRRMRDVTYIDLPTGHWPQFTKPGELVAALMSPAWA